MTYCPHMVGYSSTLDEHTFQGMILLNETIVARATTCREVRRCRLMIVMPGAWVRFRGLLMQASIRLSPFRRSAMLTSTDTTIELPAGGQPTRSARPSAGIWPSASQSFRLCQYSQGWRRSKYSVFAIIVSNSADRSASSGGGAFFSPSRAAVSLVK